MNSESSRGITSVGQVDSFEFIDGSRRFCHSENAQQLPSASACADRGLGRDPDLSINSTMSARPLKYAPVFGTRLMILLLSGSIVLVAGEDGGAIVVPMPQAQKDKNTWWYARHRRICEQAPKGGAILMIGDSIMQGWEDEGGSVWHEYYDPRHAINLGFNNDRTEHVLWRLQNGEIDGLAPKLAVVLIGTNDIAAGYTGGRTALGIQEIVMTLRERLPNTAILLLAIFPRTTFLDDPSARSLRLANRMIAHYADGQHVFYLDLSEKFLDENGHLSTDLLPDLIHPNRRGYRVWAEAMEEAVVKLADRNQREGQFVNFSRGKEQWLVR